MEDKMFKRTRALERTPFFLNVGAEVNLRMVSRHAAKIIITMD